MIRIYIIILFANKNPNSTLLIIFSLKLYTHDSIQNMYFNILVKNNVPGSCGVNNYT